MAELGNSAAAQAQADARFTVKDIYYKALIEGEAEGGATDQQKVIGMVARMKASASFSLAGFFLGPMYWAYRKCYAGAALLIAVYILAFCAAVALNARIISSAILFVGGFLFFAAYRRRAVALICKAKEAGASGPDEVCSYLRARGGTSLPAAIMAGAVYLGIAVAIIAAIVLPTVGI